MQGFNREGQENSIINNILKKGKKAFLFYQDQCIMKKSKEGEKMLEELEKELGYQFKNKNLLINALTHTSYAYEQAKESNEKLEFLGDAILEFVTSEYLFSKYKNLKEGEMT